MPVSRLFCLLALALAAPASAADLTVDLGIPRTFTTEELLARPDVATITVPADATYVHAMTYRAVPLRALLGAAPPEGEDVSLTATDGFVTNLPAALITLPGSGEAVPWLAIEPPEAPWPPSPDGKLTGPFYLVWLDPAASGILREQWPYAVASIGLVPDAAVRWPGLAVGTDVPEDSPIRAGQKLVMTQCMVCHPVAGAGDAAVGPDLDRPRSPTEYFQPWALKAYIRDPASLRSWSGMEMPAFPPDVLSDPDIEAIIAYLGYLAENRK